MIFNIGDRVIAVANYDGNDDLQGLSGTIVGENNAFDEYPVEFDDDIAGHSCTGRCADGYGWYVLSTLLVPEEANDIEPVSVADFLNIL